MMHVEGDITERFFFQTTASFIRWRQYSCGEMDSRNFAHEKGQQAQVAQRESAQSIHAMPAGNVKQAQFATDDILIGIVKGWMKQKLV